MVLPSAQATPSHASSQSGQHQWLPGHVLQAEDPDAFEWMRFGGDALHLRARSFHSPVLWVAAASAGASPDGAPRRLRQLQWRCTLQAGVSWRMLTLRDGPTVRALIEGEPLAAQRLVWPQGLLVQHGLMLRWELMADAQDRGLVWQDVQLDWM